MNEKITINRLPVITWNRLKMNEAIVDYPGPLYNGQIHIHCPNQISYQEIPMVPDSDKENSYPFSNIPTGMGADIDTLLVKNHISAHTFTISEKTIVSEPLKLDFVYNGENAQAYYIEIHAKENSEVTILMDYTSLPSTSGFIMVQTKVHAKENAKVHLVQVQRLGAQIMFLNDVGGIAEASSNIHIVQLVLDGTQSYAGLKFSLIGEAANLNLDSGYQLKGKEQLDINYIVHMLAPDTTCDVQIDGVLREYANKILRATIDIQRGAFEADGNEQERVLALDDTVINRSLPVILCGEENVQGNHGATMGKLDDALLFYLESRGISKEDAYEIIAKSRIEAVIQKIEHSPTKTMLLQYIKGVLENEEIQ